MQTEVGVLGHIVGRTGLACYPEKLSAVRYLVLVSTVWHEPNRVKAVRQFVGFVGYYRRFVIFFAELFDTDASLFAVGCVLNQIQNEEEVVIAYASRSLRISQRRYCTTRRETIGRCYPSVYCLFPSWSTI